MSVQKIAKFINKSMSYVYRICDSLLKPKQKLITQSKEIVLSLNQYLTDEPIKKHSFTQQQIRFILSDRTMRLWSGKSLEERVALILHRYPYIHVTVYKLRKLYRQYNIKYKMVRQSKEILNRMLPNVYQDVLDLNEDVRAAIEQRFRIV